jgi:hypothetical protein
VAEEDDSAAQDRRVLGVKFGERVVCLRDLPLGTLVQIAEDVSTVRTRWTLAEVVSAPMSQNGAAAEPIIRAVADWIGPEALSKIPNPLTFGSIVGLFTLVDEDLPEPAKVPDSPPIGAAT